jgi:DNA polymerase-3 subunit gamma/tau
MELDAATHGLVDDARDLRDKAFFAPVQSRYKIYIIDEAHQLGPGAANALLKVVEEPPPHVLFIFATTEPDKLIATIRSRTHHYPFRLVPPSVLAEHLEGVCKQEGIAVAKGVIPLVVRASGGSVRDALSVLGQLLAGAGKEGVTYEVATALLGYTDGALLDEAIDALAARDGATLFNTVNRVVESGHDPRRFTQDFLERLRDLIIVGASKDNAAHILREYPEDQLERMSTQAKLLGAATLIRSADIAADGLTQMRGATAPRLILELICARILLPGSDDQGLLARIERLENGIAITAPVISKPAVFQPVAKTEVPPVPDQPKKEEPVAVKAEAVKAPATSTPSAPKPNGPVDIAALRKFWPEVIENVKKQRRLTWSLLSASAQVLAVDDKAITIGIVNSGARDSFVRSESDVILRKAFAEVVGLDLKVECIVDPTVNASTTTPERTVEDPSDAAELSGAELLAKELGAHVIKKFTNDV